MPTSPKVKEGEGVAEGNPAGWGDLAKQPVLWGTAGPWWAGLV